MLANTFTNVMHILNILSSFYFIFIIIEFTVWTENMCQTKENYTRQLIFAYLCNKCSIRKKLAQVEVS